MQQDAKRTSVLQSGDQGEPHAVRRGPACGSGHHPCAPMTDGTLPGIRYLHRRSNRSSHDHEACSRPCIGLRVPLGQRTVGGHGQSHDRVHRAAARGPQCEHPQRGSDLSRPGHGAFRRNLRTGHQRRTGHDHRFGRPAGGWSGLVRIGIPRNTRRRRPRHGSGDDAHLRCLCARVRLHPHGRYTAVQLQFRQ